MYVSQLGQAADHAAGPAPLFGVPICARVLDPGIGQDHPEWIDYSELPASTPDQQRIEAAMEPLDLSRATLLHVGIGNSQLAQRFAGWCLAMDGLTISPREQMRAQSLGLPNYRAILANKYASVLPGLLGRQYDLIVDNNLASFACCGFHLLVMFSNYQALLRPGGAILTDRQGMEWSAGDARWRLTVQDLLAVAERFSLRLGQMSELVYALVK